MAPFSSPITRIQRYRMEINLDKADGYGKRIHFHFIVGLVLCDDGMIADTLQMLSKSILAEAMPGLKESAYVRIVCDHTCGVPYSAHKLG